MNATEAKRLACREAALIVQNAMEAGWEYDAGLTEDDTARYEEALESLIDELRRRGRRAPSIRPLLSVGAEPMPPTDRIF